MWLVPIWPPHASHVESRPRSGDSLYPLLYKAGEMQNRVVEMAHFEQVEDRLAGGWRAIGSAWLFMLFALALFGGFSTLLMRSEVWFRPHHSLTHFIIPRHDPVCDPAVPSSEGCAAVAFPLDIEGMERAWPM